MEKGYYTSFRMFDVLGPHVAIHNKNGKGLLQVMNEPLKEDDDGRNPQ